VLNFQLKYAYLVVFDKIIYYVLSVPKLFRLGQKVFKFEFTIKAIIIFVKNIKKVSSGMFTLFVC